jgi:hypothetical protein
LKREIPDQHTTIEQILELRRNGLSLRAIAAKIGGAVSYVPVKNILSRTGLRSDYSLKAFFDRICGSV